MPLGLRQTSATGSVQSSSSVSRRAAECSWQGTVLSCRVRLAACGLAHRAGLDLALATMHATL